MRIRAYQSSDLAELERIHQQQALGYEFPNLEHPLYFVNLVATSDRGRILGALIFRLTSEVMVLLDPGLNRVTAGLAIHKMAERGETELLVKGMDEVHAFVPRKLWIFEKHLRAIGFRRGNRNFLSYYKQLSNRDRSAQDGGT
ncbi:MAG TPA: hypothetical protein VIH17_05765 [Candidatus Acidoferrales bacterium]